MRLAIRQSKCRSTASAVSAEQMTTPISMLRSCEAAQLR
jgi:hypothetical protein